MPITTKCPYCLTTCSYFKAFITSTTRAVANLRLRSIMMTLCVCAYVSVCLSVRYLWNHTCDLYHFFVHDAYGRGCVLLRRRCNKLTIRTFGFVDIMFLPRDAMLAQYMLSSCVCLFVLPSVGHTRYCTKTAKRKITQTAPYDSPATLGF